MRLRWTNHAHRQVRRRATKDLRQFRKDVQEIFDKKEYLELHIGPTNKGFAYFKWRDLTYKIYLDERDKVITLQHGVYGKSIRNLQ